MKEQKKENTTGGIPMVKDSSVTLEMLLEVLLTLKQEVADLKAEVKELKARLA